MAEPWQGGVGQSGGSGQRGSSYCRLAGSNHCQPAWTIVAARVDFTSVNHELGLPVAAVAQVYTSRRPTNTPLEHRYIFSSTFDTLNVVHERKQRFMPEILAVCLKRAKYFKSELFFQSPEAGLPVAGS